MLNNKSNQFIRRSILTLLVALPLSAAMAAGSSDSRPERPKGPPAEAFTACESLSEGDACTVTTPRGEMTGSCKGAPNGETGPLACAPEGGPQGGGRG